MSEVTKNEWTATVSPSGERLPGSTFNPWIGCTKVSQGCKFCYADAQDKRFGPSHWGPGNERKMMTVAYWRQPLRWSRDAAEANVRRKVFCASMADVFEQLAPEHPSFEDQAAARERLWSLIDVTTHLDWLLLTKRPENVREMVPPSWWGQGFPANVWIGTSVEDQAAADTRIPQLLTLPARVRFLSCEPLLGPVDLTAAGAFGTFVPPGPHSIAGRWSGECVHWVIAGGESGPGARPMHPDWARSLRDQCQAAGVPFFFKQWGEYSPEYDGTIRYLNVASGITMSAPAAMYRLGKHAAGRSLDGRQWDEMPGSQEAA